ncbi:hypothetical protein TeGR_g14954, partial [Tetraparma gracilis]
MDDAFYVVPGGQEATGRWTKQEHLLFLAGLRLHGKEWKRVASHVKTRTVVQTRTHAQKYFQKVQKTTGDEAIPDASGVVDIPMGTSTAKPKKPKRSPGTRSSSGPPVPTGQSYQSSFPPLPSTSAAAAAAAAAQLSYYPSAHAHAAPASYGTDLTAASFLGQLSQSSDEQG